MILEYISGPLIGAVIGYFTNYIAVKMLFYPKKEVLLFGHRLPFTPGAIPKGKPRLAKAVGDVVGNTLITQEDVEQKLISDEMSGKITDFVMKGFSVPVEDSIIRAVGLTEDEYLVGRVRIIDILTEQILDAALRVNIPSIIAEKGSVIINEKLKSSMLKFLVPDELVHSMLESMGKEVERIILEEGPDYIKPLLSEKIAEIEEQSTGQLLEKFDISEQILRGMIADTYKKIVHTSVEMIFSQIQISKLVQDKIDAMDMDEVENLVLTVMKNELGMIVNLGALIGFVLGILNIFLP